MSKVVSDISTGCPYVRECRNNACYFRQTKVLGIDPLKPNVEINEKFGKAYIPPFSVRVKGQTISVVCNDYKAY